MSYSPFQQTLAQAIDQALGDAIAGGIPVERIARAALTAVYPYLRCTEDRAQVYEALRQLP
jgi:hypothetical protein